MHVNNISIQNFRGFEDERFNLNTDFTVVIGDNGVGKSSLLYALQVALGAYFQCLPIPASPVYRRQFKREEKYVKWDISEKDYISNRGETQVQVEVEFAPSKRIEWTRVMLANGTTSHSKKHVGQLLDSVEDLLQKKDASKKVLLPIVASFGTERTVAQQRKGKLAQKRRSRMEKGYLAALSAKVDFDGVIEWLHNYESELKYEKEFSGTREAVFEAITTAIPYLEDVSYNSRYQELEAIVNIDDKHFGKKTHSNMSDGLIAMLNLVAEVAFRCVILNGYLGREAVKQSRGIVMIDELDMHLHPNWQRHVMHDLKKAFPNIQFIVTTHSPFIVQSVKSDELIIIDDAIKKAGDPFRKSIEEVAAQEMGVQDIPRSIEFLEMQNVAEKYYQLIATGKTSDTDAQTRNLRKQLNELEERFGEDPAFVAALKIERQANNL